MIGQAVTILSEISKYTWYPRPDSNRHGLRPEILSLLCLPFHHVGTPGIFED